MTPQQFQRFSDIAYQRAGIRLREGKESLVSARIAKRMRELGMETSREYLQFLEQDEGDELVRFLDAISTNFTSFFREMDHFDRLAEVVKEKVKAGQSRFRLWSAACSTGEEPYSVAMTLCETLGSSTDDWLVLATDISTRVLNLAHAGIYDEQTLAPLSKALRLRHFERVSDSGPRGPRWKVKDELRRHVVFKRLNLSTPPFPMTGPLDAVFCRNVMIYFDQPVRQRLISGIETVLGRDGVLFIGHSETLSGVDTALRPLKPSVYMRTDTIERAQGLAATHSRRPQAART